MDEKTKKELFSSYMIGENDAYIKKFIEKYIKRIESLCDLTNSNLSVQMVNDFPKKHCSLENTIDISKQFLQTIDEKYVKDFDKKLNDGTFVIYDVEDKTSEDYNEKKDWVGITYGDNSKIVKEHEKYVETIRKNNKYRINIPMYYKYFDIQNIIHEYAHSLVDQGGKLELIFLETIPIAMEYYSTKFLEDIGIEKKDTKKNIVERINCLQFQTTHLKEAIDVYKQNKHNIDYNVIINDKRNKKISQILMSQINYILGDLYGLCIYNDLCNGVEKKDIIKNLIHTINIDSEKNFPEEMIDDIFDGFIGYLEENSLNAIKNINEKYLENESVKLQR